jgi:uncharacterized protein YbjQ (UPF0145 family)
VSDVADQIERCPRCDARVRDERYCLECGLDRFPRRPVLPTVEAHDAAARARAWRARHPGHSDPDSGEVLVTTCERLTGYEVLDEIGLVHGLVVRSRNVFSTIGADLKSFVGGELGGFTQLLDEARQVAVDRMIDAARDRGANAVIGMRFDTSDISAHASELLAYGTAVLVQSRAAKSGPARSAGAGASPDAAA